MDGDGDDKYACGGDCGAVMTDVISNEEYLVATVAVKLFGSSNRSSNCCNGCVV